MLNPNQSELTDQEQDDHDSQQQQQNQVAWTTSVSTSFMASPVITSKDINFEQQPALAAQSPHSAIAPPLPPFPPLPKTPTLNNNSNNTSNETPSTHTLSLYERLRQFLYINFILNKYSFILFILNYTADLILFVALNLYLFSNKAILYEPKKVYTKTSTSLTKLTTVIDNAKSFSNTSTTLPLASTADLISLSINESFSDPVEATSLPRTVLKQSYLTLQIIIIFVFFICFILSYLIKLQFKLHRLAINLYDTEYNSGNGNSTHNNNGETVKLSNKESSKEREKEREQTSSYYYNYYYNDRDGIDSLASTTTASHFSSSNNSKKHLLSTLIKRFLHRLMTKLSGVLLHFFYGYQFCQNCFIEKPQVILADPYAIFLHLFIFFSVIARSVLQIMSKKNSMNQLTNLKRLQEKAAQYTNAVSFPAKSTSAKDAYFNYYYYMIRMKQNLINPFKKHQYNQTRFKIMQLNNMALYFGFICSLFHLYYSFVSVSLFILMFLVMFSLLLVLILIRLKSILFSIANLTILLISVLVMSNYNNKANAIKISSGETIEFMLNLNLFSYNFLTFLSFLITFYLKSFLNIYYCTLTSLERWNLSFLSGSSNTSLSNRYFWRKLLIYASFFVYVLFIVTCTGYSVVRYQKWSILILPFFYTFTLVWLLFQVLNIINLNNLLNKISDCYLLLNETNSIAIENSSGSGRHHKTKLTNRASTLTHQSSNNLNGNNLRSCSTSSSTSSHLSSSRSSNKNKSRFMHNLRKFLRNFLNYNKLGHHRTSIGMNDEDNINSIAAASHSTANNNIPIHRILAYKGVRHLGSISYRICIYCLIQTAALAFFVILIQSSLAIMLYLCILNINFIWLSLLYQFSKTNTGTCIAYALVAPPLILNVYNNTLNSAFDATIASNRKYKTAQSTTSNQTSSSSGTNTTSGVSSTNTAMSGGGSSAAGTLPFNYQQALTQRCNFILNKIQLFLNYHLIENFGCDFASNGLHKASLEAKIKAFFKKKTASNDAHSPYYNTYLLYYCGPTSPLTDNLAFIDGNELSIEEICNYWREIHCDMLANPVEVKVVATGEVITPPPPLPGADQTSSNAAASSNNSRLIILLDAENTSKSIDYVKSKLLASNTYIALQTVKYNFNSSMAKKNIGNRKQIVRDNAENKLIVSGTKKRTKTLGLVSGPPGSPQTLNPTFYDTYLNIGKFTLDWIRSNANAILVGVENEGNLAAANFENVQLNAYRYDDLNEDEDEEMEEDSDLNSENDNSSMEQQAHENDVGFELNSGISNKMNGHKDYAEKATGKTSLEVVNENQRRPNTLGSFFYETKFVFSKYWIDYTFDSVNQSQLSNDLVQFWNLYYPYMIFRPLLQLINCRVFYLKFEFLRKGLFYMRRFKNKIITIQEYDTGHGFKLFSS